MWIFFVSKAKTAICAILSLEQGVIATSPSAKKAPVQQTTKQMH